MERRAQIQFCRTTGTMERRLPLFRHARVYIFSRLWLRDRVREISLWLGELKRLRICQTVRTFEDRCDVRSVSATKKRPRESTRSEERARRGISGALTSRYRRKETGHRGVSNFASSSTGRNTRVKLCEFALDSFIPGRELGRIERARCYKVLLRGTRDVTRRNFTISRSVHNRSLSGRINGNCVSRPGWRVEASRSSRRLRARDPPFHGLLIIIYNL